MNSLFSSLIWLSIVALMLAFAFLIGFAGADAAVEGGPTMFLAGGFLLSLLVAYQNGLFMRLFLDSVFETLTTQRAIAVGFGLLSFLIAFVPVVINRETLKRETKHIRESSLIAQQHVLRLFEKFDSNADGTVTSDDLDKAETNTDLSKTDRSFASAVKNKLSDLGHETARTTSIIPCGISSCPVTTIHYGITKNDLETYPKRMIDRYRNWQQPE